MDVPQEYLQFVKLFNEQKFFEAHEALEVLWRREKGAERSFYQGLIQIAAVFVHLKKGTRSGGEKVLDSACANLQKFRPSHQGLDLEKLLSETRASLAGGGPYPRI